MLYFDLYATPIPVVLFGTYNILRAIVLLFYSNIFQSFGPDGKSLLLQLYLPIKGLIFDIICGSCPLSWWSNAMDTAY